MSERLMQRVETAEKLGFGRTSTVSRRIAGLGKSVSGAVMVIAFAVASAAAAGGLWWKLRDVTPGLLRSIVGPPATEISSIKPLFAHWDMRGGQPQDLDVFQGSWIWQGDSENGGSGMKITSSSSAAFRLPQSISAEPVLVTLKFFIKPGEISSIGCFWATDKKLVERRTWCRTRDSAGNSQVLTAYLIGRYIVGCQENVVESVIEYPRDYPADRICISLANVIAKEIEVRSIKPSDIPPSLRDIPKLIEQLGVAPEDCDEHGRMTTLATRQ
jgi:hypothetical protein